MSEQFLTEAEKNQPLKGEKGNSRQAVLLVLLGVVAVAGYLYFFTGLIKPREQAAKEPAIQSAQVKNPMPPRIGQPSEKAAVATKPEEKKPAAAKEEKPAAGEPVQSKPAPVQKLKPAATARTVAKKPAVAAGTAQQEVKPAKKTAVAAYRLKIGEYVVDKEVKVIEAKLKKLGITPVERRKTSKLEPMHRLFYAEFSDHDTTLAELQKLKKTVPDAFFVQENDKFVIYAGSYYREGKAAVEQDRLYDKGVKLIMKKAEVSVPVIMLTAGSYSNKNDAQKGVARLKKTGIVATIIKTGKEQE